MPSSVCSNAKIFIGCTPTGYIPGGYPESPPCRHPPISFYSILHCSILLCITGIAVFYFVLLALQYGSYVFQTLQFYISVFKLFLQYCISVFQVLQEAEACLLRQIVTTIRILKKSPHFVHVKRRS